MLLLLLFFLLQWITVHHVNKQHYVCLLQRCCAPVFMQSDCRSLNSWRNVRWEETSATPCRVWKKSWRRFVRQHMRWCRLHFFGQTELQACAVGKGNNGGTIVHLCDWGFIHLIFLYKRWTMLFRTQHQRVWSKQQDYQVQIQNNLLWANLKLHDIFIL